MLLVNAVFHDIGIYKVLQGGSLIDHFAWHHAPWEAERHFQSEFISFSQLMNWYFTFFVQSSFSLQNSFKTAVTTEITNVNDLFYQIYVLKLNVHMVPLNIQLYVYYCIHLHYNLW